MQHPKVFFSYSWDSHEHRAWVRHLASLLQANGIKVLLDEWDTYPGIDLPHYMETSVREADYVLLICTPTFAARANAARGGVGYEKVVVTGEIFSGSDSPGKFVPILRRGDAGQALPSYLKTKLFIDFRNPNQYSGSVEKLLRHLHRAPQFVPPPIGARPQLPSVTETLSSRVPVARGTRSPKAPSSKSSSSKSPSASPLQTKALPSGVITAMFTDIVSSTKLKGEMEGDTAARRDAKFRSDVKAPHDKVVLACIEEVGGHTVKSTGDGYLFAFTDAEEAVLCALKIQDQLRASPIETPLGPLQLRIGLHTGMASFAGGDYTASSMDKAARVEGRAEPGHVFVSRETHALVTGKLRMVEFEKAGPFDLKGLASEDLYRAVRIGVKTAETERSPIRTDAVPLAQLQNPYEFDATATEMTFKGREAEIEELLDSIESSTHTAVFGLQRMGKTSLIEEGLRGGLKRRSDLSHAVLLVKIDMHRLGGDQVRYRDFVHEIIEAVVERVAATGLGQEVQNLRALTRELFIPSHYQRGDRAEFFSVLAKLLVGFADATDRRIVLFIDEFSEVRKVIERNKTALQRNPRRTGNLLPHDMYIDVPFIHHLGSLLKDRTLKQKFTLIVLVRPFLAEYDEREDLQLLKLMKPITLYYLDEEAAKTLITEPLEGQVAFENGAVSYLSRLTAGHPYLLQFILKLTIDRIKRDGRRTVVLQDIASVEKKMVSEGPAYDAQFAILLSDYSVDEVIHPKEALLGKGLLALIAKSGHEQREGWVYENQIFEALLTYKMPPEKTASLLAQFMRTKILEETTRDGKLCYRLAIPLLRKRFVRQNLHLKYFR